MKLKNKLKCLWSTWGLCSSRAEWGQVLEKEAPCTVRGGSGVVLSGIDEDTGGCCVCDTQALGGPRARLSGLSTGRVNCWGNHKVYDRQEDCVQ